MPEDKLQSQLETIPEELGMLERLDVVTRTLGFYPTTHDELNDVVGLVAFSGKAGKSARHLNEILLHQHKADTDQPEQAVRSKVAEFEGFAVSAQSDCDQLEVLRAEVAEMMNPKVSIMEDLEREPGDLHGLTQLVRYLDLKGFLQSGGTSRPQYDPFKKATRERGPKGGRRIVDVYSVASPSEVVVEHIEELLQRITVKQARHLVGDALTDQQLRRDYWIERLIECKSHLLAKPIAVRALRHLGVEG